MNPTHIRALTGLRSFGALWVMFYHFRPTLYEAFPVARFLDPIISQGNFGVPLFFILSGFVIAHNYEFSTESISVRQYLAFMKRRFARLLPTNVITTLLSIPLVYYAIVKFGAPVFSWMNPLDFIATLLMFGQFLHPVQVWSWNQPAWSLTGEIAAYLLTPLLGLYRLPARFSQSPLGRKIKFLSALALIFVSENFLSPGLPYGWLIYLLAMYFAGSLIASAKMESISNRSLATGLQILCLVAIGLIANFGNPKFLSLALALLIVSVITGESGLIGALLKSRPFFLLGEISFSIYMLHWLVFGYSWIVILENPGLRENWLWLATILMCALVLTLSFLNWKYIERPARQKIIDSKPWVHFNKTKLDMGTD